ncbi:peptidase M3 [Serinibacter arcticus]|uniref:Dipeptidyl carboxypeptidase n=1 Tax=Serinibacter arcticus TaxID=1655435 RepID=A0A2U1ZRK1_9MICO|nr:M3 family metallopeptidase [Serinibacter arcticus]PWD49581.1 peptidase M3 [Serinibacter arcticus]
MAPTALDPSNPFAAPSTLDYGLPPLDRVELGHFRPAIEAGFAQQRAEWEAIATDPEPATYANTIEALELAGDLLTRTLHAFFIYTSSIGGDELDAIAADVAPELSAHGDAFRLDPRLFARYEAIAASGEELDPEATWLLEQLRKDARRAGVALGEAEQEHLRSLNAELTSLETLFGQQVVAGMKAAAVPVTDPSLLAGLSDGDRASLAQSATDRGSEAGHLVTLILPTSQPILVDASSRDLRAEVQSASTTRGTGVDAASDTRQTILHVARRRAERAQLLGFPHHAAYVAADGTAGTSEAVMGMLRRLAPAAARNALAEAADLETEIRAAEGPDATLTAADWPHYAAKVRQARYDVDMAGLRPYLELERVLVDGVFWTATQLYGITFTERTDLPTYADGMRVWEVSDADGTGMGLFLGDYHAREGKRGGAWMTSFVNQSRLKGTHAVVTNTLNVPRPPAGEPTLLTWDEVITTFHEFGHALHGLLSDVHHPSLSGTSVPRDFVEYPSQVNEMWATHPAVMARYARHHVTGEALDLAVVERLREAAGYGEGFRTTEYLGAALLDQAWHHLAPEEVPTDPADVLTFEKRALADAGLDLELVPPRYRSTYFNHTFAGGYDAGYYSYIWSEVLDADTQAWFEEGENGGLDADRGRRFRETLLSRGHSADPLSFYRELRGRDADITPLLVRRGLQ